MQSRYADLKIKVNYSYLLMCTQNLTFSRGILKKTSPITLLKCFATLRFPWPSVKKRVWSALRDSKDLVGNNPLLVGGSMSLELGMRHHKQLWRPVCKYIMHFDFILILF